MKWRVLIALATAEFLGLTLWFSASAITPALVVQWHLDEGLAAWLTMSVQLGFVVGTLLSALLNLPDVLNARHLFAVCAFLGALANGAIGLFVDGIYAALWLRFLTGVFLAGVYPPGMKIMATWFKADRGMAIGVLVGALTLGSAAPHLLKIVGGPDWRTLMLLASLCSVLAGLICLLAVKDGPHQTPGARFDWRVAGRALTDRGVRLANFGYLGHQWELYAVWTWISLFLYESFSAAGLPAPTRFAALSSFAVIGIGGLGCVAAGILADRYGRTRVTIVAMAISGSCCLLVGPLFGRDPYLLVALCLVWGFFIVADSAQFSTSITELSDPAYVGTTLTLQTCLGFLLTLIPIRLVPYWVATIGWQWAFAPLALGPVLGILAMYRLRQSPAAAKIGGESKLSAAHSDTAQRTS
jgi:MFS family permease